MDVEGCVDGRVTADSDEIGDGEGIGRFAGTETIVGLDLRMDFGGP